jgi:three-Cys-motif partner protein|tara:strand:+ start:53500 stop:54603 length:1104 start_codon:yes stop_codon:yes gene_type:complete
MKDSQINMLEHSEVKVKLLGLYMERYLNILYLSKYIETVILFDLFCGEGIYENGGKGSPIIMLESINNLEVDNSNKSGFEIHFNDIDLPKVNKLQNEITNRDLVSKKITGLYYTNNDYQKMLPYVVSMFTGFSKRRGFIFIDPYGYKEIRLSHIKELLRPGTTEVLLFLPTHFMFRFEEKGTPQSLKEFISELIPESQWPKSETGIEFIDRLKNAFKKKLGNDKLVDTFIISRDKNQFFCLFFFTSHIYGFDRMLDAKWKLDEEQGRGFAFKSNGDLFSVVEKSANTFPLEKGLKEFLKTPKTNGEVYEFALHLGYLPTHTNQILKSFQDTGNLEIKSNGDKIQKGAFYVNYKNYKNNFDKITINFK